MNYIFNTLFYFSIFSQTFTKNSCVAIIIKVRKFFILVTNNCYKSKLFLKLHSNIHFYKDERITIHKRANIKQCIIFNLNSVI